MESRCYRCRSHYYSRRTFQLGLSPSSGSGFVELFSPWNQLLYRAEVQGIQEFGSLQFHSVGFITIIQGCVVHEKYIVTGKVRQSQRMNDPLILIWVIAVKDATVNSAHCLGCKAGMAESCSHVASVLFYIEAWTRIFAKLSCTQVKCTWLLPRYVKEVPCARVRDIDVLTARKLKTDLDAKIDRIGERREVCVASHGSNLRTI